MNLGPLTGDGGEALLLLALPGALFLLLAIAIIGSSKNRLMARRVERVKLSHDKKPETQIRIISARRKNQAGPIPGFDELVKKLIPRQEMLRLRLARAGLEIALGGYVLMCLAVGLVGMSAGYAAGLPFAAALLVGVVCGLGLPHSYVGNRFKRRQARFINHFPDAIDLMVRGVKAGLPITESIKAASEEIPDPVSIELKRITDGIRLGRKLNDLLAESCQRLDLPEFNFFTIALTIQSETGGNLAETLNNLSEVLRGRRQLKRKIKALSSEAKASAYIIGSLPFIMTLLIYLVNSGYIMGLFNDPRGQVMIGFGLCMIAAGAFVMYRMVRFEI